MTENRRQMSENIELGSWTRRRPMGRDYAAAKNAEVGKKENEKILNSKFK
jgi:hypothetical protein